MATARMTLVLRIAPFVLLAGLEAWVVVDLLGAEEVGSAAGLGIGWLASVLLFAVEGRYQWHTARSAGSFLLGGTYLVAHTTVLGLQLVPALVFVTLLISQAELRILARRFAPLFAAPGAPTEGRKIGAMLARTVSRLSIALALAIVVPLVTADLAQVGLVPMTTIPTVFLLSAALVVVVLMLAFLPSEEATIRDARFDRGTKDN